MLNLGVQLFHGEEQVGDCFVLFEQEWSLKQLMGCAGHMHNVCEVFRFAQEWSCKGFPVHTRFAWEVRADLGSCGLCGVGTTGLHDAK